MATPRICSIDGCGKPHRGHGFCNAHLLRWQRHGDPLSGGTPFGEPQKFLDEAIGFSADACLTWPFGTTAGGYGHIVQNGRMHLAHRLVCAAVNGPAPSVKYDAAHSCGDRRCVSPQHLRWATRSQNQMDRVPHLTSNRGERHGCSKLTEADVRNIRQLKGKLSQTEIGRAFGVSRGAVYEIHAGKNWAWLAD